MFALVNDNSPVIRKVVQRISRFHKLILLLHDGASSFS
jgi:hypothetical protein